MSAGWHGFSRKSTAPAFIARTAEETSAKPVITTTGNAHPRAFSIA